MLKNDFYKVTAKDATGETSFKSTVVIDKHHDIFKGHFPEIPVVPGVCMIAMIKELLNEHLNKALTLKSAGILKFLSIINPLENTEVEVNIKYTPAENDSFIADGSISAGDLIFFKITRAVYH